MSIFGLVLNSIVFLIFIAAVVVVLRWPRTPGKGALVSFALIQIIVHGWWLVCRITVIMLEDGIRVSNFLSSPAYRYIDTVSGFFIIIGYVLFLVSLVLLARGLQRRPNEGLEPDIALPPSPAPDFRQFMRAANPSDSFLAANISLEGAALNVRSKSCQPMRIRDCLAEEIGARLSKKGIHVKWQALEGASLVVRFVQIDQGNQLLRYIVPFLAPARCEIEGSFLMQHGGERPFHFERRTDFSLFGGFSGYMLKVCARRLADDVSQFVAVTLKHCA